MESPTSKIEQTIKMLQTDPVRNSSIIGFMNNYSVKTVLYEGDSLLVKGKSDVEWIYISSKDKAELRKLISGLDSDDQYFASIEDWMIPEVTHNREVEWQLCALRYYLPGNVTLPETIVNMIPLKESDAEFVVTNSNYKKYISTEYISERIRKSFSAAVVEDKKLAAWALTHDDGAIGALHVLKEYRKKGYAKEIIINLAGRIRNSGFVPIAQIEEKNIPAIKLFSGIGFVMDRKIIWLKLK
jgi:8-oxo-dGTP diphosphatase